MPCTLNIARLLNVKLYNVKGKNAVAGRKYRGLPRCLLSVRQSGFVLTIGSDITLFQHSHVIKSPYKLADVKIGRAHV